MKKNLALILAILMVLCTFASCDSTDKYVGNDSLVNNKNNHYQNSNGVDGNINGSSTGNDDKFNNHKNETLSGIEFKLNADKKSYTLVDATMFKEKSITIDKYNGLPITIIGNDSFAYSDIENVTIGNSVISIGDDAFYYCLYLKNVTMSNNVIDIGNFSFSNCPRLSSINISSNVVDMGDGVFFASDALIGHTYDNAIYLGNAKNPYLYLLSSINKDISSIEIHPQARFIGDSAFSDCYNITNLSLPSNIIKIGKMHLKIVML